MNALMLVLSIIIAVIFIITSIVLFIKNQELCAKLKYVDEANMWHKLAIMDDLTKIYNRNAFNMRFERIKENIKSGTTGAIIVFDIDDFKLINDTKGHLMGDEILIRTARILYETFPEPKYGVFRIGGDEFAVLSENVMESEIVRRLLQVRIRLSERKDKIRLSKGYSLITDNPEEAFKYADEMLYADKLAKKIQN